jgi:hypothetical protein
VLTASSWRHARKHRSGGGQSTSDQIAVSHSPYRSS